MDRPKRQDPSMPAMLTFMAAWFIFFIALALFVAAMFGASPNKILNSFSLLFKNNDSKLTFFAGLVMAGQFFTVLTFFHMSKALNQAPRAPTNSFKQELKPDFTAGLVIQEDSNPAIKPVIKPIK